MPTAIQPGIVAKPQAARILTGETILEADGDLIARIVSSGNVHRALPGTRSICTAVASRIEGTVVHRVTRPTDNPDADVRILHPSGLMVLAAKVQNDCGAWFAQSATIYRTQRRMFEGYVCLPASKVPNYVRHLKPLSSAAE